MEFKHKPVLYEEVIEYLNIKPEGTYVDGTLGGAGHTSGICNNLSENGTIVGIDRDPAAINVGSKRLEKYLCNKIYVNDNYYNIKNNLQELGIQGVDGIVLDLGVSSFQLDNPERGFSYMNDAPLDMRMNPRDNFTAEDIINNYDEKQIYKIIKEYGEEKWAKRIAAFITDKRKDKPIKTTGELVEIIKAAIPASARREGPHPAKRTFQAIRIEVNSELELLEGAVENCIESLKPGGRICIITFHSLEDRIVKEVFNKHENPCTCPKEFPVCVCGKKADIKKVTKKPVVPGEKELEENPRARSAKLRVCQKL